MLKSWNPVLVAALTSVAACGARPEHPQAHAETAVWWSPQLDLRNIEQLTARLHRAFGDRLEVVRGNAPPEGDAMVDCASYLRLRPLGFEPRDDQAFGVMQQYGADCRALALLARAKPSKDASLAGLLGKRDVTRQLPAVLGPQTSPVDVERRTAATSKGIPWGELDPSLTVNEQSPIAAVLSNAGEHTKLELLAAGDFDGDHLQDVVIKTASHGDEGNWTEIRLWLLGQSPTGPLRVLERLEL